MNVSELRRSAIPLLIGIIASIVAFSTIGWLQRDRCLDAGGAWDAVARRCTGASGAIDVSRGTDILAAVAVGVLLAFMLFRAATFATQRRRP